MSVTVQGHAHTGAVLRMFDSSLVKASIDVIKESPSHEGPRPDPEYIVMRPRLMQHDGAHVFKGTSHLAPVGRTKSTLLMLKAFLPALRTARTCMRIRPTDMRATQAYTLRGWHGCGCGLCLRRRFC